LSIISGAAISSEKFSLDGLVRLEPRALHGIQRLEEKDEKEEGYTKMVVFMLSKELSLENNMA
jgi:hypothetical protein